MTTQYQEPDKVWKDGGIEIAQFTKSVSVGGETKMFKTFHLSRSYLDREGNWRKSSSYSIKELERVASLLAVILTEVTNEKQ